MFYLIFSILLLAAVRLIWDCALYEIRFKCRIKIVFAECWTMRKSQSFHDLRCWKSLISNDRRQPSDGGINLVGILVGDLIGDVSSNRHFIQAGSRGHRSRRRSRECCQLD